MSDTQQVVIEFPMNSGAAIRYQELIRAAGGIAEDAPISILDLSKVSLDCPQIPEGQVPVMEITDHPGHLGYWVVGHLDQDRVCTFDLNVQYGTIIMVAKGLGQDITVKMTLDVRVDTPTVVEQSIEPIGEDDRPVDNVDNPPSEE